MFDENKAVDLLNNSCLRDFTNKPYQVLTRDGWDNIEYVYKHKCNKNLHRIKTKDCLIDVTEDHSLFDKNQKEISPKDLKIGDNIELFNNIKSLYNNSYNNINKDKAWLIGLFIGDGSSVYKDRPRKYFSKKEKKIHYLKGSRCCWKISNQEIWVLEKAKDILLKEYNVDAGIKDHNESSQVYNLKTESRFLSELFSNECYTSYRYKKIPKIILNSSKEIKKSFMNGFMAADGYDGYLLDECRDIGQKSKIVMAGINLILKELDTNFRITIRKDKHEFINFQLRNRHRNPLNDKYSKQESDKVSINEIITSKSDFVYDISSNGTFVNALGYNILHNTDGFNFSYTDVNLDYIYIGKGLNRNTKEGKVYKGIEAYVAEFNDLFMREKMGLGLDEIADRTINFSRKNYAELLGGGKVKYVGNSIKSKKMPKYIEKFLESNILLLLNDDGYTFLKNYYDYIEKIYNYGIPLRDIASIGSIKISLNEYKKNSSGKNKSGGDKGKQAWYELALQQNIPVHPGDKIHYVNIGKKKSEGDVIKEDIYEYDADGNVVTIDRIDKKTGELVYAKRGDTSRILQDKKVIATRPKLNCVRIEPHIIEADEDYYGHEDIFSEPIEYNAAKYIQQFNNRIKALLVCFHPDIRNRILIDNPEKRNYFTKEDSILTSGFPNKEIDQDTLEGLLTMEDKEIRFWTENNLLPPFLDEIGIDWYNTQKDYFERQEQLKQEFIQEELKLYNNIINKVTEEDIQDFHDCEDGDCRLKLRFMVELLKICNYNYGEFNSIKHKIKIGTIYDILDKQFDDEWDDDGNKIIPESDGASIKENGCDESEQTSVVKNNNEYYYTMDDYGYTEIENETYGFTIL
jgi:hypothetical protein